MSSFTGHSFLGTQPKLLHIQLWVGGGGHTTPSNRERLQNQPPRERINNALTDTQTHTGAIHFFFFFFLSVNLPLPMQYILVRITSTLALIQKVQENSVCQQTQKEGVGRSAGRPRSISARCSILTTRRGLTINLPANASVTP